MEQPVRWILQKSDLIGQMVAWAMELTEFDLKLESQTAINGQVLVDFITEMVDDALISDVRTWSFHVDSSSNLWGSGVGVILESPDDIRAELSTKFEFWASNNQVKYNALIVGLNMANDMEVKRLNMQQFANNQISSREKLSS